jgi:hypothetical protein
MSGAHSLTERRASGRPPSRDWKGRRRSARMSSAVSVSGRRPVVLGSSSQTRQTCVRMYDCGCLLSFGWLSGAGVSSLIGGPRRRLLHAEPLLSRRVAVMALPFRGCSVDCSLAVLVFPSECAPELRFKDRGGLAFSWSTLREQGEEHREPLAESNAASPTAARLGRCPSDIGVMGSRSRLGSQDANWIAGAERQAPRAKRRPTN